MVTLTTITRIASTVDNLIHLCYKLLECKVSISLENTPHTNKLKTTTNCRLWAISFCIRRGCDGMSCFRKVRQVEVKLAGLET